MIESTHIRAVIADDEPPARRRLLDLLAGEPDIDVVAECRNGPEAIEAIRSHSPDLVFLDVQMPGADGFDVVAEVGAESLPAVIFVTAYDQYALRAFEVHALDYLLKPFDRDRFRLALDRARTRLRTGEAIRSRLLALLAELDRPAPRHLERIPVKTNGRIVLIEIDDVDAFEAEGNYVRVIVGDRSHLIRESIGALEAKLDPARFLRIHRSTIIRLDRIAQLEPLFQGEYRITLRGGLQVRSSRRHRARLHAALGIE